MIKDASVGIKIVFLAVVWVVVVFVVRHAFQPPIQPPHPGDMTAPSVHFIGMCSGMAMDDPDVQLVAVAGCMGRVRGFVDGHDMTISMGQIAGRGNDIPHMWCVTAATTTNQLMTDIMDWVEAHPKEYRGIIDTVGDADAAMVITVKALHAAYPCVNT